jgi:glyoxylase-like metal-dependent hydrolase (beta-lactamase superfamily II)
MNTSAPTGTLRVTVHRGTNEIGASCIEVASATTRIILDCGWPLDGGDESEPPPVPGLFAPGSKPDAVLLSHSHPDHTGFIGKIPIGVPIYAIESDWAGTGTASVTFSGTAIHNGDTKTVIIPNIGIVSGTNVTGSVQLTFTGGKLTDVQ